MHKVRPLHSIETGESLESVSSVRGILLAQHIDDGSSVGRQLEASSRMMKDETNAVCRRRRAIYVFV